VLLGRQIKEGVQMAYILNGIGPDPDEEGADVISCDVIDRFPETKGQGIIMRI
jgi:hypothetical protein